MEHKYSFEKLDVWNDARKFVIDIYALTKLMPAEERFGLCSQIQRASVSIVSNIAEGTTRFSDKEKIRYIEIAYGSLMEVYCQLYVALDLKYITIVHFQNVKISVNEISNKLNALNRAYQKRLNN
jgi:four helix bundle protein